MFYIHLLLNKINFFIYLITQSIMNYYYIYRLVSRQACIASR
jgi:hypothetical protein